MVIDTLQQHDREPIADDASDYGSDIDDATALDLLSQAESQPLKDVVLESIEEPTIEYDSSQRRNKLRVSHLWQSSQRESSHPEKRVRQTSIEVEYDEGNRISFSRKSTLGIMSRPG